MKKKIVKSFIVLIIIFIIYYISISLFLQPVTIKGMSMFPTVSPNEIRLSNRWKVVTKQELKRGDIILFEIPVELYIAEEEYDENNLSAKYDNSFNINPFKSRLCKRIIGISGDYIQITADNKLYVNGENVGYANHSDETGRKYMYVDLIVPEGSVYVMGDNRKYSTDSRSFGCIPIEKVYSVLF